MALVRLSQTSHTRSPCALAPRNVDGTSPPDQRWASADLSLGPAHKSRPGLCTRQGPNRGAELPRRIDNVSSREVSKDGGSTARRRPNLSITSPQESIAGSMCRQPVLHSLASKTRAPSQPTAVFQTQPFHEAFVSLASKPLRARLENPTVFHTQYSFFRSLHSLASTQEHHLNRLQFCTSAKLKLFTRSSFALSFAPSTHEHAFSRRSRQTTPLSSTSSPWPHPPSRLGGAYRP